MLRLIYKGAIGYIALSLLLIISLTPVDGYSVLGECQPYGDVNYEGKPVENDLVVEAKVGDVVLATSKTMGGGYHVTIPADNESTPDKDGWNAGDVITIYIDGKIATPSFTAFTGTQRHNLEVRTLDVKLDTWGKIKALFK
ncbi:MAG: hypothetical protein GF315_12220 [candidate division Zixibacteria bacterium]|nr:hypothetical protein [candidate division Zixibacteria bacterium]